MGNIILTRDLTAAGVEFNEVRERRRRGDYEHLRRGAYVEPSELSKVQKHRLLVEATAQLAQSESVVSFGSAGVLHELPVTNPQIERVHLTRLRSNSGRIRPGVHVHVAPLDQSEVTRIDGMSVTSLDRTFLDLGRTGSYRTAVAVGDAALRRGMDLAVAYDRIERAKGLRGIRTVRRAITVIDGRAESVGESYSRLIMLEHDLPKPDLQIEIIDGGFSARVDFLWPGLKVVGEFDGKIKYGRLLRPGEDPGDVVFREKVREDHLRDLGYIVVRWIWDDLLHPERLVARILRALEAAERSRRC